MNGDEARQILTLVTKAWPRPEMERETVAIYAEGISDLPGPAAIEAVKNLIRTEEFRPSVARIRRSVLEATHVIPTLDEALAQAEALEDWHYRTGVPLGAGSSPERPEVHPLVEEAWNQAGEDFLPGVFTARYREAAERETRRLLESPRLGAGPELGSGVRGIGA